MINVVNVEKSYLEVIYRITMKRIAKGLSPEKVSGIICREPDYITAVEMLWVRLNSERELQEIAWALGEQEITGFLPKTKEMVLLEVMMEKEVYGHTCIHTCDVMMDEDKEVPFFFLQEDVTDRLTCAN